MDSEPRNGDFLIGAAFVLFGGFVVFESLRMPYWEKDTFMMSPGIVPLISGAVLALLGLIYGGKAMYAGAWRGWHAWGKGLSSDPEMHRLVILVGIVALYAVGLVGRVNFLLATFLFHALVFAYLRIGGWVKWGGYSVGATLLVAVLLPKLFDMPLPEVE